MKIPPVMEIPSEFKGLFEDGWREAAIYGGRYSLKSHTVARFLLISARLKKERIACFREFQNSIAESSHQLLSDLIHYYGLRDFEITDKSIINSVNGSDFLFKGLHLNEQSIKSIEGIDKAWVEEAQTVSKESLEVLTPTIRKPGSKIVYTYNRLLEDDPVHQRLVIEGRPNTLKINVNYDVAKKYNMIPDVILREIEDDKLNRPALYKHKWLGEPNSLEKKIYKDWAIIDTIPHEARLERYGLDFGFSNDPTAIVAVYKYNDGYIFDEKLYSTNLKNTQIASYLLNLEKALVIADSSEPKSIAEIAAHDIMITGARKGSDSKIFGIQFVQDQKISMTNRSQNLIKEYRSYLWKTDNNDRIINDPIDGNDHCFVGSTSITTLVGSAPIKNIKAGDEVLTSKGFRKVIKVWDNGVKPTNKYTLHFDTNSIIIECTPNHLIKTTTGWTQISKLQSGQIIYLNNLLTEKSTSFIREKDIFQEATTVCTQKYGAFIMEKYLKDSIYITKMATPGIIGYQTFALSRIMNIFRSICMKGWQMILTLLSPFKKKAVSQLNIGTQAQMVSSGTKSMESKVMQKEYLLNVFANFAGNIIKQKIQKNQNTVIKTARLRHFVVEESKRKKVYDLTVDECHEYIANGLLVHNCMDAIRYALTSIYPDYKQRLSVPKFATGAFVLNNLQQEEEFSYYQ